LALDANDPRHRSNHGSLDLDRNWRRSASVRISLAAGIVGRAVSRQQRIRRQAQEGKVRHGNPVVRYLLCEAANAARRTKTVFRAKYESLAIRRGHKKTIIALAHKLIRTIYVVLERRKPYHDTAFDYQAASVVKNAPQWIRAPKKYGYWPRVATAN
jgi:hypothetical protein